MAGEFSINGEAVGPWKLVASAENAGSVASLSAYTTTQYNRLLFRIYVERASSTAAYPYFYFLDNTGTRLTDFYNHRMLISYGTSFYSNETTGYIWLPGYLTTNLRYDTEDNPGIFEMLYFNIDGSSRNAGYLANWGYRTSTNIQIRAMGYGRKYMNPTINPVYGIEATTNSGAYTIQTPKIEVYGDTTLT